jgi:hypothetical protein
VDAGGGWVLPAQVIALDGKTVRGSQDRVNGKQAIHMVSAWASANHLVLAQMKVDQNTQGYPMKSPRCRSCWGS